MNERQADELRKVVRAQMQERSDGEGMMLDSVAISDLYTGSFPDLTREQMIEIIREEGANVGFHMT